MDLCPKIITTSSANRFPLKPASYSTRRRSTGASYCLSDQYACWVFDLTNCLTRSDQPLALTGVCGVLPRNKGALMLKVSLFLSSLSWLCSKSFAGRELRSPQSFDAGEFLEATLCSGRRHGTKLAFVRYFP